MGGVFSMVPLRGFNDTILKELGEAVIYRSSTGFG